MKTRKQIGQNIVALLLMSALMLPMLVKFTHVFEAHEHEICHEQTTHIHADVADCQICHFQLVSFDYKVPEYVDFFVASVPQRLESSFSSLLFHSFKITNTQLRAPPHFLS
ncbi:hypothetical protein [Zobellia alginiliquefaciens]|uniref:hypothetical protein n=1 Tax=Zobellia alginiliquefaciens TaxID=3032586 RepID=UPI0023E40805|nr:hypothetical protein [Zobellia alginiliquefaciens]